MMRFVCGLLTTALVALAASGCNGTIDPGASGGVGDLPAPVVDSVSPASGTSLGGDSLTVLGSNFYTGAVVSIGATPCASTVFVSSEELTCLTPGGAAGANDVFVANLDNQVGELAAAFTYVAATPPDATAVLPVDGTSAGGTEITISGTDFASGATVTVDGAACTGVVVTQLVAPNAEITCTTPESPSGPGTVDVVVTNIDGQSDASPATFDYMAPSITLVSPATGPIAGGTSITITGMYFHADATVAVGGVDCPVTARTGSTELVCTTPAMAAGTEDVVVTHPDAQTGTAAMAFTFLDPPAISAVSPTPFRSKVSGGVAITLTGTGFVGGATVDVGGVACTGVTVVGPTQIDCTSPAHVAGDATITVTNVDGQSAEAATPLEYYADLAISQTTVLVGQSQTIDIADLVSGGVAPYTYAVTDAQDGTFVPPASDYTAPADATSEDVIEITDSETPANVVTVTVRSVRAVQVAAGDSHTCVLVEHGGTGSVKCWGYNGSGQLGLGHSSPVGTEADTMGVFLAPVDFGAAVDVEQVVAGQNHTCVRFDDGSVKCWGRNSAGQLGQENVTDVGDGVGPDVSAISAVPLGTGRTAVSIASGLEHVCALLDDATIKCWGSNVFGQLGQDDNQPRGEDVGQMGDDLSPIAFPMGLTPTAVVAGGHHSCAVFGDGTLRCWGRNNRGQLGRDNTANVGDGVGVSTSVLPAIDLGGNTVYSASVGSLHTCAVIDDGVNPDKLRCWGDNTQGQLGRGNVVTQGSVAGHMAALTAVGFDASYGVSAVAAGGSGSSGFTCAWLDDGMTVELACWGYNASGQLGREDTVNVGDDGTPAMGALDPIDLASAASVVAGAPHASKLALGSSHACAIITDDVVKCWGLNSSGQLGLENTVNRGDGAVAASAMDDDLPEVQY